ncbi:MAG: MBL fold metallo-hydrolase [Muribaculaceae bacterium]|nr:MBL fold metallo-hydrolase [Muribaculaceae bacterium]
MEFTRIIHPVGQGGFYSESLKFGQTEFTVVYDCGGKSKDFMEKYLENYFPKKEDETKKEDKSKKKKNKNTNKYEKQIDAVFISHLHEDHVNGLDFLLNQFHVRYLFLPQLTKDEILEVFLYNYFLNPESIGNSLLRELYSNNDNLYYLNTRTRVIKVPHSNEDLSPYNDEESDSENEISQIEFDAQRDLDLTEDELNTKITILSQGAKLSFKKEWLYIPFNPPVSTNRTIDGIDYASFEEYFKEQLNLRDFSISDLPSIIKKKTISKCRKIYGDYFGPNHHNAYSMTLYSGPVNLNEFNIFPDRLRKKRTVFYHHCPCLPYGSPYNPNCLYMGDFETKDHFDLLRGFYKHYWKTIASIQVPHHGSSYNFEQNLYEYPVVGYISVGEDNKYNHPNIDTLIGIREMMCEPILVTEKLDTIKIYSAEGS